MHAAVVGLGFGDEGKGSVVDYLVRERGFRTVVRFNGGAQAAHHVVAPDGRQHCFAQFGSGTLAGARTHLTSFVLVNPLAMLREAEGMRDDCGIDPLPLVTVDEWCPIITPFHRSLNRLRELARGDQAHGSCGMGIGETRADLLDRGGDALRAGDLIACEAKLDETRHALYETVRALASSLPHCPETEEALGWFDDATTVRELARTYADWARLVEVVPSDRLGDILREPVIFEGAQGVLLDEDCGFHPHTTWSRCTFANIEEFDVADVERWGVLRGPMLTRHGPGPFPTEDEEMRPLLHGEHNAYGRWQGAFRVGRPDLVLARYALRCAPCDRLALTWLDRLPVTGTWPVSASYKVESYVRPEHPYSLTDLALVSQHGEERHVIGAVLGHAAPVYEHAPADRYPDWIAEQLGVPIGIRSYGPTSKDKLAASPTSGLV